MHAELRRSEKDGRWRYKIVAANGEPVAASEPYATKSNARRAVKRVFPEVTKIRTVK